MMRAVVYSNEGQLSLGPVPLPKPGEGQILLKVITSAVNRADILQKKGLYPPPAGVGEILGLEAAGIVEELGNNCHNKWNVGDKVIALLPGCGNAEFVCVNENHVFKTPQNFDWPESGAVAEVWLTAYQLLAKVAEIKQGQTVLVHAAASGVGTAAVQLITKLFGGIAYGTSGSEDKIKFVKDLGAKDVFNSKEGDFVEKVLNATDGKGVNIVLDCIGGQYCRQNCEAIATDSRWVLYGLMGGIQAPESDLLAKILRKRIRIEGSTLRARSDEYKGDLIKCFETDVLPLFENGVVKPIVDSVYPLGKIAEAHQRVEENKNIGKVVVYIQNESKRDTEDHSIFE